MQIVIGLDIGSYSIKAVEIVNTFNSYEISNFYENVIPEVEQISPDVLLPACMEQLFKENDLHADRIITAIRGQYISSRIQTFAFADQRKIAGAVMAEVEDAVPFNLDDMIVDHQILGTVGGKTVVLVVMTKKVFLKNFLEHLQKVSIDPKLVDVDSLALYNLTSHMSVSPDICYGLVDIGHEKTSVCLVQNGILKMFRSINLGGRYLSEFLARDLEVNFSEAQRLKHRVSRVLCDGDQGANLNAEDKDIAERLTLASNSIIKELGRTLYAFKNWEKTPVSQIFLSGGTSRIQNFDRFLQEQLEIEVVPNRLEHTALKISPNIHRFMPVMPQSVAIGLRAVSAVKRHSQINLRRGEFAYVQDYEAILRWVGAATKVIGVALMLLFVSYFFRSFFYNKQITALNEQYQKEFVAMFPDAKKSATATTKFKKLRNEANSRLQSEINQRRRAVDEFIHSNSGSAALLLLNAISQNLPSSEKVKVDVTSFQFAPGAEGGGNLTLKGETDSYESVNVIVEALKSVSMLKDVQEKQSGWKPGTNNKVMEFTVQGNFAGKTPTSGKG